MTDSKDKPLDSAARDPFVTIGSLCKRITTMTPIMGILCVFLIWIIISCCMCDQFQSILDELKPQADPQDQAQSAKDVIHRLIPGSYSLFNVEVDPNLGPSDKDTFQVLKEDENNSVTIIGSSGVAACWGFHHYLKHFCNCHVSWDGDQLALPDPLPAVNITISAVERFRYYQNVVTTSYSFVWWDWNRWERELDWMALNGINFALAFIGQELIWQRVFTLLNLSQSQIDEHFTGPAFLSWGRMGNMRGWGGPLPSSWHEASRILQLRILNQMRLLGMVPILPAFAGHVPRAFKQLFPGAAMTKMGTWNQFSDEYCCPYLLEPTDPLFKQVGRLFISEMIAEYGTDHFYNCDTFNEMVPHTSNETYLAAVGSAIFEAMSDMDPKAVWVLQGWMFYSAHNFWEESQARAFIMSVPLGRMIVLDLQSELNPQYKRLQSYFGQPFIWCMLHNFGGTLGLYGAADNVNNGVFEGRTMNGSTMIGIGLTPEGINQNYVMYDLVNDMAWRTQPANLSEWFSLYAQRRYGKYSPHVDKTWNILKTGVYNFSGLRRVRGKYIICRRPSLRLQPWGGTYNCTSGYSMHGKYIISSRPSLELEEIFWYNTSDLQVAWDEILRASSLLSNSTTYQHDLVDISRQCLQVLASGFYTLFVKAYRKRNTTTFQKNAAQFLHLLYDLELLLASNDGFLLGTWLKSAKLKGTSILEQNIYEFNARNQITLWGPKGEIRDYANKQWSGIISHYFIPRWELFLERLNTSLIEETAFNESKFNSDVFTFVEEPFTLDLSSFPDVPQGNSIQIADTLHQKWRSQHRAWTALKRFEDLSYEKPQVVGI